jgi:hypothetical protein
VLLKKFWNVGFEAVEVVTRAGFALADLGRYPLFSPEFLRFLADQMPAERHPELVRSIVVRARQPAEAGLRAR